jgi:hypothetical protein
LEIVRLVSHLEKRERSSARVVIAIFDVDAILGIILLFVAGGRELISKMQRANDNDFSVLLPFECRFCHRKNWNPNDVINRYCGHRRVFMDKELRRRTLWAKHFAPALPAAEAKTSQYVRNAP